MIFRIGAPQLDFYVDVRLRHFGDAHGADGADGSGGRWLAVADIGGDHEIGLGRSASEALAASIASLGAAATAGLLADPQLPTQIGDDETRPRRVMIQPHNPYPE